VLPSSENIRSHLYPPDNDIDFRHQRDSPPDQSALNLCDWLLSPAGQSVVEESGYVPILELPAASD
jgi:ABC-type phosphate transport system substrate-binding protein